MHLERFVTVEMSHEATGNYTVQQMIHNNNMNLSRYHS